MIVTRSQQMDSGLDVPGSVDEDDAFAASIQEEPLQNFGTLVVQRIVVPLTYMDSGW